MNYQLHDGTYSYAAWSNWLFSNRELASYIMVQVGYLCCYRGLRNDIKDEC